MMAGHFRSMGRRARNLIVGVCAIVGAGPAIVAALPLVAPAGPQRRNPDSAFHLSLKISYPDVADRADAAELNVDPGGDIFIHGAPNWWVLPGTPPGDWTQGCIAVTDAEIEEIRTLVRNGTPVEISP